ncbi:hypothetical protein MW887_006723 [Aspergillus wentii]|nr:hypothetical protein MW887_006723 [Aspergillus wentii]
MLSLARRDCETLGHVWIFPEGNLRLRTGNDFKDGPGRLSYLQCEYESVAQILTNVTKENSYAAKLPYQTSHPLVCVSEYLQINPWATISAFCLWNISFKPGLTGNLANVDPDDISTVTSFTDTQDEEWFFVIPAAIESQGGKSIPIMLKAIDAARAGDDEKVQVFLSAMGACISHITEPLARMYDYCTPSALYHMLRPFLSGSRNMAAAGLPDGVFYPSDESGMFTVVEVMRKAHCYSCLISSSGLSILSLVQREMRKYVPGPHRAFLELMTDISNIREYAMRRTASPEVKFSYNRAVSKLSTLRDRHLAMVSRYIIIPASNKCHMHRTDVNEWLKGTGGTNMMQFLSRTRNTTKKEMLLL